MTQKLGRISYKIRDFRTRPFYFTFNFLLMVTPRIPLGLIDNNVRRRQPLTLFTRGYIEKGAKNSEFATSIAQKLGLRKSIIRRTLKLNPLRIDGITQSRSGRSLIMYPRFIRRLLRLVQYELTLTYTQIKTRLIII